MNARSTPMVTQKPETAPLGIIYFPVLFPNNRSPLILPLFSDA